MLRQVLVELLTLTKLLEQVLLALLRPDLLSQVIVALLPPPLVSLQRVSVALPLLSLPLARVVFVAWLLLQPVVGLLKPVLQGL